MAEAKHDQAVALLTGLERFVRLVVERQLPVSQAHPTNLITPSEKSPYAIGVSRPYTGLYNANSYMVNRPGYAGYRRSMDANKSLSTNLTLSTSLPTKNESLNDLFRMNCGNETKEIAKSSTSAAMSSAFNQSHLQPTSRCSVSHSVEMPNMNTDPCQSRNISGSPTSNSLPSAAAHSRSMSPQEDIQMPKPLTSQEFQAMIPAHFLRPSTSSPSPEFHQGPVVTVTIKQPENLPGDVSLPPSPTTIGKVTETITKSTLTETVVTRVTDNYLVSPVIIEVCPA